MVRWLTTAIVFLVLAIPCTAQVGIRKPEADKDPAAWLKNPPAWWRMKTPAQIPPAEVLKSLKRKPDTANSYVPFVKPDPAVGYNMPVIKPDTTIDHTMAIKPDELVRAK